MFDVRGRWLCFQLVGERNSHHHRQIGANFMYIWLDILWLVTKTTKTTKTKTNDVKKNSLYEKQAKLEQVRMCSFVGQTLS